MLLRPYWSLCRRTQLSEGSLRAKKHQRLRPTHANGIVSTCREMKMHLESGVSNDSACAVHNHAQRCARMLPCEEGLGCLKKSGEAESAQLGG